MLDNTFLWATALPPEVSVSTASVLVVSSAITAALTAGLGIGGGVLLLGIMAFLLPPLVVIPIHGAVQIGANVGRTWLMREHINRELIRPFVLGAALGAGCGGLMALQLPARWLNVGLALFILYAVWGHWPAMRRTGIWLSAIFISFFSMFVGATGPLVAALMKTQTLDRQAHMATFSACMSLQHGLKIAVFGWLGFHFGAWLPLLGAMVASGALGTWLGERWLAGRTDSHFQSALHWLLTAMALQLLWQGLTHR